MFSIAVAFQQNKDSRSHNYKDNVEQFTFMDKHSHVILQYNLSLYVMMIVIITMTQGLRP